jgi:hypothetical protein
MMAEENTTEEQVVTQENEGQQAEEVQTVSAEEFAQLKRQLEETRKAQSGSDKRVQELQEMLKQKEQEAESASKTAEQKWQERLEEIEKKLKSAEQEKALATQRSVALEMLQAEGLKAPKFLDRLIGEDEEVTRDLVQEYIEDKKATAQQKDEEWVKKTGRKVTDSNNKNGGTLDDYTDDQIAQMSDEEFLKVVERSKQ